MRINVYQEELTGDVQLVSKSDVIGADGGLVTFYGIRFFLEGTDKLHRTEHDDDRPAITFWYSGKDEANMLFAALDVASGLIRPTTWKM